MKTAHEWYLKMNSYANPDKIHAIERGWIEKIICDIQKDAIKYAIDNYIELCQKQIDENTDH